MSATGLRQCVQELSQRWPSRRSDAAPHATTPLSALVVRHVLRYAASWISVVPRFFIFRYKDQAEKIIEEFGAAHNALFTIVDTAEELVDGADVVVSCITDANGYIVDNEQLFKPGVLVVPVHTRGFQNCDTTFDKVFADDTDHVKGFKYFSEFREYHQFEEVLKGQVAGRSSDTERILAYNIGLGLHDVLYASRIYDMLL